MGTRSTLAWDQQGNRINLGLRSHWDKNNTCTRTSGAREQQVHENNTCTRTSGAREQHVHENNMCMRTTCARDQNEHEHEINTCLGSRKQDQPEQHVHKNKLQHMHKNNMYMSGST